MSRTTRNHLSRAIAVAGLLTLAGLIRPEVGQAQASGPEAALLNRIPAGTDLTLEFGAYPAPYTGSAVIIELPGERALLGRTEEVRVWWIELGPAPAARAADEVAIDGERALLGRSWP